MCSLLIYANPNNDHPDPSLDWTRFKRGDVIDIDDDKCFWGIDIQGPKSLGLWRVVVIPGIPAKDFLGLQTGDEPSPTDPRTPYRLRVNKIDVDALEAMAKDIGNSAVAQDQFDTAKMVTDKDTLLSIRTTKPPLVTDLVFAP